MSEWRKEEADRIAARTDLTDEQKAYQTKLVMMTREEMNAHTARRTALMLSLDYTIELTGYEVGVLRQAAQLNRRMLDRSPEHTFFDEVFGMFEKKCAKILDAEWDKVK